jgi:hypothetical protein
VEVCAAEIVADKAPARPAGGGVHNPSRRTRFFRRPIAMPKIDAHNTIEVTRPEMVFVE